MKIKQDFVTNSSSTSFTFIFKGACRTKLNKAIRNHGESFNLRFDEYGGDVHTCTVEDIIKDIKNVILTGKERKIIPIQESIKRNIEYMEIEAKYLELCKKDKDSSTIQRLVNETISDLREENRTFRKAIKNGFESVFISEWGDNHGDITGGNTGNAMDYEGREINIKSDDLIVFTKQNR